MLQQNVRKFADALQQSYLNYFGMLPNLAWIRGHQNFYVVRVKQFLVNGLFVFLCKSNIHNDVKHALKWSL